MNITLVDLKTEKHFVVPEDGNYLVRRANSIRVVEYTTIKIRRELDPVRNIYVNKLGSFSPSTNAFLLEQITHISSKPVK